MFVGYSDQHPGDTFRMFNPKTKKIHNSRDVLWLRRMFYVKPLSPNEFKPTDDNGTLLDDDLAPDPNALLMNTPDELEAFDAAPLDDKLVPAPATAPNVEAEEDDADDDDSNDDDDDEDENESDDVEDDDGDDEPDDADDDDDAPAPTANRYVTRSGRTVKPRVRFEDMTPDEHDEAARLRQSEPDDTQDEDEVVDSDSTNDDDGEQAMTNITAPNLR